MSKTATIVRYLVCGVVSLAVFVLGGGWLVHYYLGNKPQHAISMKVVKGITLIHSVPGLDNSGKNKSAEQPQRMVPGFVQLTYTVGKDGRAHNIHVLHAVPEGVYEKAAQTVIEGRRFEPAKSEQAASVEHTKVVHFRVPASEVNHDNGGEEGG